MADGTLVTDEDLELEVESKADSEPFNLREVRDEAELRAVKRALGHTDGNISKTAELLGITRPTLYNLMKKLDMDVAEKE